MKKVSAIVPNYNGGDHVLKCVQSLLEQDYPNVEIIIVDNCSTDGSGDKVKLAFPALHFIQSERNTGWGIACNMGIKAASGGYIALLNNDAYLDKSCITEMVRAIEKDPAYGSCASKILLWDEPEKIEVCGLVIYPDGSSCGRGRLRPSSEYGNEEEVFCANDCCCLYRREMLDEIGEYDPDFFIYCDETDMGWRHQIAGWKCIYTPKALAYHAHSRSAGSYSDFKAFHVERNRIFLCFKYLPLPNLFLSPFYSLYRYYMQWHLATFENKGALAHYKKNRSIWAGLRVLIKAHLAAFARLPVMWKRRMEYRKFKKLSDREIMDLFKRFGINTRQMAGYE